MNSQEAILNFIWAEEKNLMIDTMLAIDLTTIIEYHFNPENFDMSAPIPGTNITRMIRELEQTEPTYFNEVLFHVVLGTKPINDFAPQMPSDFLL